MNHEASRGENQRCSNDQKPDCSDKHGPTHPNSRSGIFAKQINALSVSNFVFLVFVLQLKFTIQSRFRTGVWNDANGKPS